MVPGTVYSKKEIGGSDMARTRTKKEFSMRDLIFIALFTALICLIAPWSFQSSTPSGIPVTAATFILCLTAAVLGFKRGILCVILYLLLGALGVPVFAGWAGGYRHLLGSAGGYLIGYLPLIIAAGLIIDAHPRNAYLFFTGMLAGVSLCLLTGAVWLMFRQDLGFVQAWDTAVRPYLAAECIKIFCAAMLGYPLRALVKKFTG